MRHFARVLLGSTALFGATSAHAQVAESPTAVAATAADGDIVVTATRRSESVQKVPLAITALSSEMIQENRLINFQDIAANVPGITFVSSKGPSTATLQIRGQSISNDSPSLGQPIAVFVDDVYYGSQASFDADFFDVDQIAILRGPQGTTFGRNVVGGALQITNKRAQIGEQSGQINLTVNDRPGVEANGFVNMPLSEKAAARVAFSVHQVDGFLHNQVTGHDLADRRSFALRGNLRFQPTEELDIQLLAQYNHEDQRGVGYHLIGDGTLAAAQLAGSFWDVYNNEDGFTKRDIFAGQLRIDHDSDLGTLTSLTSYRTLDSDYLEDGDGGPLPMSTNNRNDGKEWQFSQEVRLVSPGGRTFEYVAGAFYSRENLRKVILLNLDGGYAGASYFLGNLTSNRLTNQIASQEANIESIAPFFEGKLHMTDQISLTVGGRYTWERKHGNTTHIGTSPFYGAAFLAPWKESWKAFTPRAIIDYRPTDDIMVYGSVSRGFKGGGWSLSSSTAAAAAIPLDPEHSTSYELGLKSRLFDNLMTLNVALYHADTKNLQVRSLVGAVLNDTNAGALQAEGVEVELALRPAHGVSLGVNYAYTDAKYSSFKGCTATGLDCSGNRAPYTPENDVGLWAALEFEAGAGKIELRGDTRFSGKYLYNAVNDYDARVIDLTDRQGLTNFAVSYKPSGGSWNVQAFVRNAFNAKAIGTITNYYFYHLTKAEYAAGGRNTYRVVPIPSRMFGATLSYNF